MQHNAFEIYLKKCGLAPETIKTYSSAVAPFVNAHENLSSFTFKQINQALSESFKLNQSQHYKNTILCAIKKYYDFLIETGQRNDHPCRTMRFKAMRKKGIIFSDLFSSAELELLLERNERYAVIKARNQLIASLLIYQGLKVREICKLKLRNLHLDERIIYIKGSKSNMSRRLDLHPRQYIYFDSYLNLSRKQLAKTKTDDLFISMRGAPINCDDVRHLIESFKGLFLDRELNPETIRISVIANWLNDKHLPLEQVQLMAGHKNLSTTAKYRQSSMVDRRAIINSLHPLG